MWISELTKPCSPAYIFDADAFAERCRRVKEMIGDIPLTYSIKANPFLLSCIPEEISHVEVCSPGELSICMALKVKPESIIYSGVMKEQRDVKQAVSYGAGILTAESILHAELENEAVRKLGKEKKKVILRLTSGNQFGMSASDIKTIIAHRERYGGLEFYGIHYYSGTQKKVRQIKKDLKRLDALLQELKDEFGFEAQLVEYGPGIGVDYFEPPYEEKDMQMLKEVLPDIMDFADRYPLGIEMGRFLAAPCGNYLTQIRDVKTNSDTNYLICDGGIHHLKYHGQTMAMQVPPVRVCRTLCDVMNIPADSEKAADGMKVSADSEKAADGMKVSADSEKAADEMEVSADSEKTADEMKASADSEKTADEMKVSADLVTGNVENAGPVSTGDSDRIPYMICGSLCTVADVLVREAELPTVKIGDYLLFGRCGAYSVTEAAALFLSRTMPQIYLYKKEKGYLLVRDFIESGKLNMAGVKS